MRKMMKYTAAAAIASAAPLMAQEGAPPIPESGEVSGAAASADMSPEQMRTYGLWPDERQAMFDGWPAEAKGYFWTLSPPRQEVFWMLSDGDRATIAGMSEGDQEQTWSRLEQQMLASQPPVGAAPPPEPSGPPEPSAPPMSDAPDSASDAMNEVDDHSPR